MESIYENCSMHVLSLRNVAATNQRFLPISRSLRQSAEMFRMLLLATSAAVAFCSCSRQQQRVAGPIEQDVYVWQRLWTSQVLDAISRFGTNFTAVVALNAEVTWQNGGPSLTHVPIDWGGLRAQGRAVGLALRVGPFAGPGRVEDGPGRSLVRIAQSLVAEARTNHVSVSELQIDFDCAESGLDAYRVWVAGVRAAIRPIPLTITTLPSWLKHAAFTRLVAATDGFVLQVHSLEHPEGAGAGFSLCNPRLARQAVERAARVGIPFRVALPTYGYVLAFDPAGKFVGLSAEGPARAWPADSLAREVRAQPEDMAGLVREWTRDRPRTLRGLIWYRLPVAGDRLNWSWPTLASVMAGKVPLAKLRYQLQQPQPGLAEIELINDGDGDYEGAIQLKARWSDARLIASDAWIGVRATDERSDSLRFEARTLRLPAGEQRSLGWLRLDKETDVHIETVP